MIRALKISDIQTDCGTQVRNAICEDTVSEYAERMTEGDKFPACHVFSDGNGFYLADGFHRIMAAQRVGFLDFPCEIHKGTIKDATWFALGANRTNGRRLTRGDVRAAVEKALQTWPDRTQQAIADQVGCSQQTVGRIKADIIHVDNTALPETRTDSMGRTRPTSYAKQEPKHEEVETEERPPSRRGKPLIPCNGMQFARMAIMDLEQIKKNDKEREEAFTHIKEWINENENI